jgi:hypothetical protein
MAEHAPEIRRQPIICYALLALLAWGVGFLIALLMSTSASAATSLIGSAAPASNTSQSATGITARLGDASGGVPVTSSPTTPSLPGNTPASPAVSSTNPPASVPEVNSAPVELPTAARAAPTTSAQGPAAAPYSPAPSGNTSIPAAPNTTPHADVAAPVTNSVSQVVATTGTTSGQVLPAVQQLASTTIPASNATVGDVPPSVPAASSVALAGAAAPVSAVVANAATTTSTNVVPAIEQLAETMLAASGEAKADTVSAIAGDPPVTLGGAAAPVAAVVAEVTKPAVTTGSGSSIQRIPATIPALATDTPKAAHTLPSSARQDDADLERPSAAPVGVTLASIIQEAGTRYSAPAKGTPFIAIRTAPATLLRGRHDRFADSNGMLVTQRAWSPPPVILRPETRIITRVPSHRPASSDASPWLIGFQRPPEGQSGSGGSETYHGGPALGIFLATVMLLVGTRHRRPHPSLGFRLFLVAPLNSPG